MCGIFGITNFNNLNISEEKFSSLLNTLVHRGPDYKSQKKLENVIFGNTRLSIIGVNNSIANLPISNENFMLAFNGEIYNYKKLNQFLIEHKIYPKGNSDSETLFLLLINFDINTVLSMIDGMYAFAFYNNFTKKLYLCRDKIGERFVYWSMIGKSFIFSSEIKTLLELDFINRSPNLEVVKDYFFTSKVNGSKTLFKDINELEPGTYLELSITSNAKTINKYYDIDETFENITKKDFDTSLNEILQKLKLAAKTRMVSDVPICFLVSGGIDSHALLERILSYSEEKKIELFFADNNNSEHSELNDVYLGIEFLKEKYKKNNIIFNRNTISFKDYMSELDDLVWYYDEPIQFVNSVLLSKLCKIMKKKNYKVALSGEGSDEIFFGYSRFVNSNSQIDLDDNYDKKIEQLYYGGGKHTVPIISELIKGKSFGNVEDNEPWRWLKSKIRMDFNSLQLLYSQKYRLQMLLQRQDRIGMMHSIEMRVPYLSPKLLSFVNQLPIEFKFNKKKGITKYIFKQAFENKIPEKIINKSKQGFPSDMLSWIKQEKMKNEVLEAVSNKKSFCQSYLDGNLAKKIVNNHFEGHHDYSSLIWIIYSLERWHKKFFI